MAGLQDVFKYPAYRGDELPGPDFYNEMSNALITGRTLDGRRIKPAERERWGGELETMVALIRDRLNRDPAGFFIPASKKYEDAMRALAMYRFIAILAGNRVMKTTMAAQIAYWEMTGWSPYWDIPDQPRNIWWVGPNFEPYVEKVWKRKMLLGEPTDPFSPRLGAGNIWKPEWREKSHTLTTTLTNRDGKEYQNILTVKSQVQDPDSFFGESVDLVIWDEPGKKELYDEARMRIVDSNGRMLWTLTPTKGQDWFYSDFYVPWRNGLRPEMKFFSFSLYDNPYIPRSVVEAEEERILAESGERQVKVRIYGQFMPTSDNPAFDLKALGYYQDTAQPAPWVGEIMASEDQRKPHISQTKGGRFRIWLPPEPDREYVVGADPCLGGGNTFASIHILDRETWDCVADWHGQIEPDLMGELPAQIGHFYCQAAVWCENNNHGEMALEVLRRLRYPKIGRQRRDASRLRNLNAKDVMRDKLGINTNAKTKPLLIDYLRAGFRQQLFGNLPYETLEECGNLSVDAANDARFMSDLTTDRIMSLAFAVYGLHENSWDKEKQTDFQPMDIFEEMRMHERIEEEGEHVWGETMSWD